MAMHWLPPPQGSLKVNVHGCSGGNGTDTGFVAVYGDTAGGLRYLTLGIIPDITPIGNQLWAIFIALKRAFLEGYRNVLVKTNNITAFRLIRNFSVGTSTSVYDIVSQIDIRLNDPRWNCSLAYVFPARNRVARNGSRMAMELCDRIYTFDHLVGGVEELLDWDMGVGLDHPDYVDVVLANNAPEPVNFGVTLTLTDQMENLGIGQVGGPVGGNTDIEMNEAEELHEVLEEIYQADQSSWQMFSRFRRWTNMLGVTQDELLLLLLGCSRQYKNKSM